MINLASAWIHIMIMISYDFLVIGQTKVCKPMYATAPHRLVPERRGKKSPPIPSARFPCIEFGSYVVLQLMKIAR